MGLEPTSVRTWKDLVEAFVHHYQYNSDLAPNRVQLQNLSQRNNEGFKEYAQRWRELAARVQPPMVERELVQMFVATLPGVYYEKLASGMFGTFSDLIITGEHVENGIKLGKIQGDLSSAGGGKKPYGGKRREGDTSAVSNARRKGKGQHQQVASITIPAVQQPQQQQQ